MFESMSRKWTTALGAIVMMVISAKHHTVKREKGVSLGGDP